jgi:hypothetical protein
MTKYERLVASDDEPAQGEDDAPVLPLVGAAVLCFLLTFLGAFVLFGL